MSCDASRHDNVFSCDNYNNNCAIVNSFTAYSEALISFTVTAKALKHVEAHWDGE